MDVFGEVELACRTDAVEGGGSVRNEVGSETKVPAMFFYLH